VNTTLYNALIRAPILINWRKVHADVGIYYAPVGFDAAVGGGDITMIFTNTLPYAIRINFFMTDGCMTAGIFRV
jgi:vancomycin resistance protein YoaR